MKPINKVKMSVIVLENDDKNDQEDIYLPEELVKEYEKLTEKVNLTIAKIKKRRNDRMQR